VLGIGFLLILSLVASAAVAALGKFAAPLFGSWVVLAELLNLVLSFTLVTVTFAMIYKIIPRVRIGWRDVWIGAAVTAVLISIGKTLIGLYLGRSTFASGFGAAGSLVVLLVWMYYSAQIFLLGAEFTWVYAHVHGSRSKIGTEGAARADAEPTTRDPAAALTRSRSALGAALQSRRRKQ
jgi:membrane protein